MTKVKVEDAARALVQTVKKAVIVRSGALGAYTLPAGGAQGRWVDAYWTEKDRSKVVDVTGAGNSFLGGLVAGLEKASGDIYEGNGSRTAMMERDLTFVNT